MKHPHRDVASSTQIKDVFRRKLPYHSRVAAATVLPDDDCTCCSLSVLSCLLASCLISYFSLERNKQDRTGRKDDYLQTAAVTVDGNILLAGLTYGNWNGTNVGFAEAAAVKLDLDGTVLWRWQVQTC